MKSMTRREKMKEHQRVLFSAGIRLQGQIYKKTNFKKKGGQIIDKKKILK